MYSILRLDQVEGKDRLKIFDKIGADAEVTDFAVYRGAGAFPFKGKYLAAKGMEVESPILDKRSARYWTSTKVPGSISKCYAYGKLDKEEVPAWSDEIGVRICVDLDSIRDQLTDIRTVDYGHGEVTIANFGEFPQDRVLSNSGRKKREDFHQMFPNSDDEVRRLTEAFERGDMKPTAKSYSTWGYRTELYNDGTERHFEQIESPEYEYEGRKYALVRPATFEESEMWGRGFAWIEVKPIEWYIDEESGLAISKDILLGGMPISRKGFYLNNFNNTIIHEFLNDEFALDIKPIDNKKEMIEEMLEEPEEEIENKTKTL
ncbi:MAG: hypothetical protein IJL76_00765 [Bacilli bacterium]|nr:hypothetical protein [Bacilli bacterium]